MSIKQSVRKGRLTPLQALDMLNQRRLAGVPVKPKLLKWLEARHAKRLRKRNIL